MPLKHLQRRSLILLASVLVGLIVLAAIAYVVLVVRQPSHPTKQTQHATPTVHPSVLATSPVVQKPGEILGIEGGPVPSFAGIPWTRLSYPTCVGGNLTGDVLKQTIQGYHQQGVRVLLLVCQTANDARLFDTTLLADVAQGNADAVQCGNEQMKQDPNTIFISPENFAKFYDLCEHAMHAVRPDIPVLLGSLDPHVGGIDYQPLLSQVSYLDDVQRAMNSTVHPGGTWDWHAQAIGLIDSWHNGYPDQGVNSLSALFAFWAQQFHVDLNGGELGKHLWVIEGTGCFKGCGIDVTSSYQVAVSHILTLITDVQTATRYQIPFFYFSGRDFVASGLYWPIGVLNLEGNPKPIRQDLPMGARKLTLSCPEGPVSVVDQQQLLTRLYNKCTLPSNYVDILMS
jgi:hypothetical protein